MSHKLLLLVILALLSLSLGRQVQRTQKRQQSPATTDPAATLPVDQSRTALDIQLDTELARWQQWLSSIVLVPSDLLEVSTILVNHRLDVPAIRKLQVSDLTAAGIKLGDAQRICLKAAENVDAAAAAPDANQPFVLAISVPTAPVPVATPAAPAAPAVPAAPVEVADGWTTFLTGIVASTDVNALANKLRLNKLTPADLPLVSLTEMQSLGVPFGDAKRILSKGAAQGLPIVSPAGAQTLGRRSFRKRQIGTIDRVWLNDVVVDPKDIDTILTILNAHRIISLGDLSTLQVSDLVTIGISLGDASRILKKVTGLVAAADANNVNTAAAVPATPAIPVPPAANATTNVTVSIAGDAATGKTISIEFSLPIANLLNATANSTAAPVAAAAADATSATIAVPAVVQAVPETPTVIVAANPVGARKRFIMSPMVRQMRDIRSFRPKRSFVPRRY